MAEVTSSTNFTGGLQKAGSDVPGSYVEGTFTPTVTLVGGAGNTVPVYSTNTGRYTRIGNRVFVDVYLTGDGGAEGAGTGQINIALPITASASNPTSNVPMGSAINSTSVFHIFGQIAGGGSTVALSRYDALSEAMAQFAGSSQNNATRTIRLNFSYEV